jgi:hypothetical protein
MRPGFESPWGRHFIRKPYGNLRGTRHVVKSLIPLARGEAAIGRNRASSYDAIGNSQREKSHSNVNGTPLSSTDQLLASAADTDPVFGVLQNPLCRHRLSVRPCRRLLSCYTPRSSSPSSSHEPPHARRRCNSVSAVLTLAVIKLPFLAPIREQPGRDLRDRNGCL